MSMLKCCSIFEVMSYDFFLTFQPLYLYYVDNNLYYTTSQFRKFNRTFNESQNYHSIYIVNEGNLSSNRVIRTYFDKKLMSTHMNISNYPIQMIRMLHGMGGNGKKKRRYNFFFAK